MVARDWPTPAPMYQALLAQSGLMKVLSCACAAWLASKAPAITLRAPSVCAIVIVMSRLFGDLVVAQGNGGSRQHAAIEQGRVVAHRVGGQGGGADGQPADIVRRGAVVQGNDGVDGRIERQCRAEDVHAGTVQGQGARDTDGARIAVHAGAEGLAAQVDAEG